MSTRNRTLLALPLAMAAFLGLAAPAQATPGITCHTAGVDPTAKIRYRTETLIKAPLSTIWRLQTDVAHWPTWQKPVTSSKRLDHGPLRPGSRFRWTTPAPATPNTPETTLVITSTVRQLQHSRCIRWTGPAMGEGLTIDQGVHVWNFVPTKNGVLVRTEETWTGAQVEADVDLSTYYLGEGLKLWLSDLKTTAESRHRT
ncbi:SRPBCC family protein [Saccharothrix violaceirubra]|uniref:Putative membrane protein n=1 Tax=Saccharothrix violaceirubra TaxID=413306 RepID=A0A7W7WWB3_9PSEU|nr:SRPBCC family protein [Saccharothrix violaceirubra]MBB4966185.1 putative membrane protein [Saccharothrix violaceirubra]